MPANRNKRTVHNRISVWTGSQSSRMCYHVRVVKKICGCPTGGRAKYLDKHSLKFNLSLILDGALCASLPFFCLCFIQSV